MIQAVYGRRFFPAVFHDVGIATSGAARLVDVISQHLKGWPPTVPRRNLNARLENSPAPHSGCVIFLRRLVWCSISWFPSLGTPEGFEPWRQLREAGSQQPERR